MHHLSPAIRPRLSVTSLAQYVKLQNCDRFLRLRLFPKEEALRREKWGVTIQPLTPLLKDEGYKFEAKVVEAISAAGEPLIDLGDAGVAETLDWLTRVKTPTVLLQPSVVGSVGDYEVNGRADVVRLSRDRTGALQLYIADVKASRTERMEHRLQVAVYAYLLRQMAAQAGVELGGIKGGVLHLQEDGSLPRLDPGNTFDLETYFTILQHLAIDEGCVVKRISALPFEQVPYHLGYQCDGCMYNALCMYDSAERMDLSLTPYITATEKRTLQENGVYSVPELATLMDLGEQGYQLTPVPGKEALVQSLSNLWPIGVNLPTLILRAKRTAARFDRSIRSTTYLTGSYGTLPTDDEHPGLIKIFFDAQNDYIQGRIYLIAALVKGPLGERTVVKVTEGPPTEATERRLLTEWIRDLLLAVQQAAGSEQAPLHLYCYNSYDQRMLLEALKRHLDAVSMLPGFFDLMTQSPAVGQPIISFLSDELEQRRILGVVCVPLHDAARMMHFDWVHEGRAYHELFRARLFDNRRDVMRKPDGTIANAPHDLPKGDPRRMTIESASRFNSQIPLEYAYAIWGRLPDDGEQRALLRPFRQVTAADLQGFAAHRVRALAHIEASFQTKARFLEKPPLDLSALAAGDAPEFSLAQSLREFLFMEHYASFQAKLQVYGLPIERRVQTGLALLLRYQEQLADSDLHRFAIAFDELGLDPVLTLNGLRLKEGAWVVLNSAQEKRSANQIKHGRLAVIEAVGESWVDLKLLSLFFAKSHFRYFHDTKLIPEADKFYTLDEMADDLNGDKTLASLNQAASNTLYQWLLARPPLRSLAPAVMQQAEEFVRFVNALDRGQKMTGAQTEVVAQKLDEPLLLVQGPPGTGKSHTIGWAVLNRLLLAAMQNKPFHVAVSCKTHNAVNIVLESIAKKWRKLSGFALPSLGRHGMPAFTIHKIVNGDGDETPEGVEKLDTYKAGRTGLERVLEEEFVVIGATPGGLYNLAKQRKMGDNQVDWGHKEFDLVVIDEASQMSVPEALLACAFLKPGGSVVVVGDHRQMPPIVAHNWETEEKRSITTAQPYLSLFEYLIGKGFPRVSLDQSFRLHESMARFLHENIYVHDGIHFYSKRKDLLAPPPPSDHIDHHVVDLVMDPNYPIVVIEHGETASQQYNKLEIALVTPLIESALAMRLDGADGVGVVVPHRAQKALLRQRFPQLAELNAIDTVERFQGGERDIIIVSATASDPDYVLAEADFLLSLNRLNVALSRPRKKLIVIASRSVTQLLVSDLDTFDNAVIWKRLYYQYAAQLLWSGALQGAPVMVRGYLAAPAQS